MTGLPICTGYRLFARNPDSNHLSSSSWRKTLFRKRPSVSNAIRGDIVLEKSSTRINLMIANLARWTELGKTRNCWDSTDARGWSYHTYTYNSIGLPSL